MMTEASSMRTLQKNWWLFLLLLFLAPALFSSSARAEGAQVSGCVYYDKNNNGVMDEKEPAIPYSKVILQQRLPNGDTADLASKTVGADGAFAFAVNQAGEYRLRVELPYEYFFTRHGEGSAVLPCVKNKGFSPFITLADGSAEIMNAGGTKSNVIISLLAFEDVNANGGRSTTEPLLKGVTAELLYSYNGETYTVTQATSDKTGVMLFRDLSAADYQLKITLPGSYVVGPKGEKDNNWYNRIDAAEEGVGYSGILKMEGGHSLSIGVGAVKTGSLQGSMWYDENFNGLWDQGESPLANVPVTLSSDALTLTREAVTDEKGGYSFLGLQPGAYRVGVRLPDGLVFTYPGATAISTIGSYGEAAAYVEVERTTVVKDIGAMPAAQLKLKLIVDQNRDGIADESEPRVSGASVTVIQMGQEVETKKTDENGEVAFSALRSGEAVVSCALPDGYIFEINSVNSAFGIATQTAAREYARAVTMDEENGNLFEGVVAVTVPAAIRGKLFEDPQNAGLYSEDCALLPGFTVQAVAADGSIMAQAVTGEDGRYQLYPLHYGDFTVRFLLNDPYVASPNNRDNAISTQSPAYGETGVIPLLPGQAADNVDGAVFRAGVVDGFIRNALSPNAGDGIRDVTVTLLDQSGAPVSEFSYGVTDGNGYFLIKGVLPGAYSVRYSLPDTAAFADSDLRETGSEAFSMTSGTEYRLPELSAIYTASVRGFVGADAPAGARVTLQNALTGETREADVSPNSGEYSFVCLRPGDYTLSAELQAGYVFAPSDTSPFPPKAAEEASVAITLLPEEQRTADIRAALPADFSVSAFYDADRNGVRGRDDQPAEDRVMSLWLDGQAEAAAEIQTDGDGAAFAGHLVPGQYTLRVSLEENEVIPDGLAAVGAVPENDGIWALPLTLDGQSSLDLPIMRYASVLGEIWNLDGSKNNVGGIEVTLLDERGQAVSTVKADDQGAFGFTRLLPGKYSLSARLPKGFLFAKEQDTQDRPSLIQSLADGEAQSFPFTVPMGERVEGKDIGIGSIGRIGDKAWLDENGNGMQDIGEVGMPGILIELYRNGELAASVTTDLYGRYSLDDLYPGEYEMRVTMHKELKATKHQTAFPLVGSILPESNETSLTVSGVVVPSGGANLHCDLGFQLRKANEYPKIMDQIPQKDWTPYSERKNNE